MEHIESNPAIRKGRPVIRGTRVPVDVVAVEVASGETIETVAYAYGITIEDVVAAVAYVADPK